MASSQYIQYLKAAHMSAQNGYSTSQSGQNQTTNQYPQNQTQTAVIDTPALSPPMTPAPVINTSPSFLSMEIINNLDQ